MRRPMVRSASDSLPHGHEFVEGGKRMRVDGCVIREVRDKEPVLTITKEGDSELTRQAASANAKLLAGMDKPSFLDRLRRFLTL